MESTRNLASVLWGLWVLVFAGVAHGAPANVSVAESSNQNGVIEVAVLLDQADAARRPVLAEVFVEFDAKHLIFMTAEAGEQAAAARKSVFAHEVSKGVIRFTIAGTNLRPMANGKIAMLRFSGRTAGPARVALDPKRTKFAPKRAREGLRYGGPITIQVSK